MRFPLSVTKRPRSARIHSAAGSETKRLERLDREPLRQRNDLYRYSPTLTEPPDELVLADEDDLTGGSRRDDALAHQRPPPSLHEVEIWGDFVRAVDRQIEGATLS